MSLLSAKNLRQLISGIGNALLGELLRDTVDAAADGGVIPHAELVMSQQPTTGDTVTIGADVYQFKASGESVSNNARIAVQIGASAALTRANLIAAINARDANNLHANILNVAGTAPAKANGTEKVRAFESGNNVVIEPTRLVPGDSVSYPSSPSILLAEAITHASDIWVEGAVNLNTLGGRAEAMRQRSRSSTTITAAMITATARRVRFPFTPTGFTVQIRTATGAIRLTDGGDTFAIDGNDVLITLAGGAAPDIQATDIVTIEAWE